MSAHNKYTLEILSSNWQALNRVSVIIRAMFNRALAFWEASRSLTTTSNDRDREMLQNSVRVVTLLGKAKMIPSILASTCEIYQFVSPYELFLLLNAIWGFLHCNPVTQEGFQNGGHKVAPSVDLIQSRNVLREVAVAEVAYFI